MLLEARHILKKKNLPDSLGNQSLKGALVRKCLVHNANEAYVRQLRLLEKVTHEDIQ